MKTAAASVVHHVVAVLLSTATMAITPCPNCGSMPVPYPLSTSPTCGDPAYAVTCTNSPALLFQSVNNTYTITAINTETQRIIIKPPLFFRNDTCVSNDLPYGGILLNRSRPFTISDANTIFYFNCSSYILVTLNCSESSLCRTYLNSNASVAPPSCARAPNCCSLRTSGSLTAYSIRARRDGCLAYMSFVSLDWNKPESQWSSPAMEIQWELPNEPLCKAQKDCDRNSTCAMDLVKDTTRAKRCYCNAGLTWDAVKGVCINIHVRILLVAKTRRPSLPVKVLL
ncbi:hypothetical protein MLD38_024145 [Melastoma candidum]|uniref:Uncharacterized protein n=1 Tax=Melastoma candidum TaxID=119954 RepID=A0ACB9NR67_9MYRT|nr:hypothetical protein MLD38_024145 [Melastoma candidum]